MSRAIRYTLTVYLMVPLDDPEDESACDYVPTQRDKTAVEKSIIRSCRTLDGDIDAEVMEWAIVDDDAPRVDMQAWSAELLARVMNRRG